MIYWFFLGIIHLLILAYQDVRNKTWVDDRHNWFMMGLTASLYSHYYNKWWFLLIIILIILILTKFINKFKLLGEADSKTILWSFIGFAIMSVYLLFWYAVTFIVIYLFAALIVKLISKYMIKKKIEKYPAYPIFLLSFLITAIIFFHIYA